jgi:hypothetical protein
MKNGFLIKTFALALLGMVMFTSCKRDEETEAVPDICPTAAFDFNNAFAAKSSNGAAPSGQVNLATDRLLVTADFNEVIDWRVEIKGQTTGAVKRFSNRSNSIDIEFTGETDTTVYFDIETIQVSLYIACKAEPTVISIANTAKPSLALAGLLAASFNSATSVAATYPNGGAGFLITSEYSSTSPSPIGDTYYKYTSSTTVDTTVWYTGGFDINVAAIDFTTLPTDPSRVYMNFYLKGPANSQAQWTITETFSSSVSKRRKFNANTTDDWTLYSVKLSDIGFVDPTKITALACSVGPSTAKSNSCSVEVDFLIFTVDGPLIKQ